MTLAAYCSVLEACRIAGVSKGYMCALIRAGKIEAELVGAAYVVLRSSVKKFERQPGMGRPPKDAAAKPASTKGRGRRARKPAK